MVFAATTTVSLQLQLSPFGGGLGATYAVHLRLFGKLIVDILLVIIELFSLGVRTEALRVNIGWKSQFLKQLGLLSFSFSFWGGCERRGWYDSSQPELRPHS